MRVCAFCRDFGERRVECMVELLGGVWVWRVVWSVCGVGGRAECRAESSKQTLKGSKELFFEKYSQQEQKKPTECRSGAGLDL